MIDDWRSGDLLTIERLRHWGIQLRNLEIQFESPIGPIANCSNESSIANHQSSMDAAHFLRL
jgi:hypothetical protein